MVRIGGLASGMDIDTLVGDLMKAERIPLNKLHQKKQILEWQRDDYRSMNKLLDELDRSIFDGISRQSTFTKKTVTTSNESAVSVRNINATSNLSSSIKVTKLAESANMVSSDKIGNTSFDPNGKLGVQKDNFNTPFNIADTKIYIEAISKDGSMPTAPVEITIDPANDSLNSVLDKINNSNGGVVAFYDTVQGKVSITAKNSGDNAAGAEIKLSGNFLTNQLKLDATNDLAAAASPARGKAGVSAEFTINGLATTRPTNTFVINGFEYTLKQTTTTDVMVNSATDEDAIFKSITDFVDKYNSTIASINSKVTEDRYRKYQPLSDEEREAMSEKQADMWDEKAKSGMLRNDSILSGALNKMRSDLYGRVGNDTDDVNNNYDQLSEIGITTSKNYLDRGKLVIDPTKLREAIKNDPNAIYNIFNYEGSEAEQGIAKKLRATIKGTIDSIEERAGNSLRTNAQYTLGRNLTSVDKQINRFEDRLIKVEDRYWRQFTAMEKAIQKANEQSAYLMSQFSSGM